VRSVVPSSAALLALALAGCGEGGGKSSNAPAKQRPAGEPAAPVKPATRATRRRGPLVVTRDSDYGRILTDGRGRTLYVFTRDTGSRSRCYGACARAWPPFVGRGKPRARGGASARLLGTTRRRGGTTQVTYKGRPVYYYVGDRRPGQVLCQNVPEYGGTWLVVDPGGEPIR
jgi:predicted lipoprotein with Yx(FWY)xxD motif